MRHYKMEYLYNTPLYDHVLFLITLLLLGLFIPQSIDDFNRIKGL